MTDATNVREGAETVAAALTAAWNAADAAAFAREFTADADFVNIFAMHVVGRAGIEEIHRTIFGTIYKDSRSTFTVEKVRALGEHAAVAHIRAHVHAPCGPLAGEVATLATAVLVWDEQHWRIASFQNTRIQPPPSADQFQ